MLRQTFVVGICTRVWWRRGGSLVHVVAWRWEGGGRRRRGKDSVNAGCRVHKGTTNQKGTGSSLLDRTTLTPAHRGRRT